MECAEVFSRLSAWLDGELEPEEARRVEEHLARCESCRRQRVLLGATSRAVRALPPETVSDGFDARLRRRLTAETTARGQPPLRRRLPSLALGLAAVLVLAILATHRRSEAPRPHVGPVPNDWIVVQEPAVLDCRVGHSGRCRIDAPCATAEMCGAFPVAGLGPGTWPTQGR
jgi:anti-sigma factor RsiW